VVDRNCRTERERGHPHLPSGWARRPISRSVNAVQVRPLTPGCQRSGKRQPIGSMTTAPRPPGVGEPNFPLDDW